MKKILIARALFLCLPAVAQSLVLLHTNDTHSNIDSDAKGVGGILPRTLCSDTSGVSPNFRERESSLT